MHAASVAIRASRWSTALPPRSRKWLGAQIHCSAHFVRDDPEHAVIDVDAPARGFLVLADQYYPGWRATVNGADVAIHRANFMFRLVEVPAGTSRVEFLYRPRSVALGAVISAAALIVLVVLLRR